MADEIKTEFAPDSKWMPQIAKIVTRFGEVYNDYKVMGLEHIPREGGVLLVLYHGLVPIDFWYLGLKVFLETGRQPCALVDQWLMKTPGLAWFTKTVGGISANREQATELLKKGQLVGVSPGGVREAIAGRENAYRLVWGERKGFARLALDAQVPIVPGFTQNVESLYHAPMAGHPFFQRLYEKTRLPLVPIIGIGPLPFPVKLTTWLGAPIHPEANATVDSLTTRTKMAIESLIHEHQGVR